MINIMGYCLKGVDRVGQIAQMARNRGKYPISGFFSQDQALT
jgi:hypothetical protein